MVFIIECRLKTSVLCHPPFPPNLCVRWCQRWWQENSAHWEETVSRFGLLVVPSYGGLSSHAVVVMPKVCLASPYTFPFFLSLSLVAHILQSFQTITQFHTVNVTLVTCKTTLCVWCSVGLIWDFPYCGVQCMICQERPVQLSLRHRTLLGDSFALWQKLDMYIRGRRTVNNLCMWYCLEWNHGK